MPTTKSRPTLRSQLDWNLPGAEEIPTGARLLFLSAWVSLYGLVTMDVFGHLGWALKDLRTEPSSRYELEQGSARRSGSRTTTHGRAVITAAP